MRLRWMIGGLVLSVILLTALPAVHVGAQGLPEIRVRLNRNQIMYTGPGTNAGLVEYVAAGREVIAAGRDRYNTWVEINLNQQIVGWVPTSSITVVSGSLDDLRIRGGLLAIGEGKYRVNHPDIRAAEVEAIRIQRPMRLVSARWNRLQAFMGASCESIPTAPDPPDISEAMIARVPELEQVRRELAWVAEQTALAIDKYIEICDDGGAVTHYKYIEGIGYINPAQGAWWNVRKFINELTGLEYTIDLPPDA